MKFVRLESFLNGIGLPAKSRADLFSALRQDIEQGEIEIGGIDAAADDRQLTPTAHLALSVARRLNVPINPNKGISASAFSAAARGNGQPDEIMACKYMLASVGLLLPD